jgi:F0F1-type ATP synthase assembly protein I
VDESGQRARRHARKPNDDPGRFLERSAKSLQENVTRSGPVAVASYTLIGAIMLLGGIGYAVDRWLSTSPWFVLGGLVLGIIVGFYELAKAVWH